VISGVAESSRKAFCRHSLTPHLSQLGCGAISGKVSQRTGLAAALSAPLSSCNGSGSSFTWTQIWIKQVAPGQPQEAGIAPAGKLPAILVAVPRGLHSRRPPRLRKNSKWLISGSEALHQGPLAASGQPRARSSNFPCNRASRIPFACGLRTGEVQPEAFDEAKQAVEGSLARLLGMEGTLSAKLASLLLF